MKECQACCKTPCECYQPKPGDAIEVSDFSLPSTIKLRIYGGYARYRIESYERDPEVKP